MNFPIFLAIRIALAYGLEVFTTVSTQQKRKFILSLFPQLKGVHIYFYFYIKFYFTD